LFHLLAEQKLKSNALFPGLQKYQDFQPKHKQLIKLFEKSSKNQGGEGFYFKRRIAVGQ
jgi:hypothetical protein